MVRGDVMASSSEFVPLRKKQKRASTGLEDNFVSSYMPKNPAIHPSSQDLLEKVNHDVTWRFALTWRHNPLTWLGAPNHTPTNLHSVGMCGLILILIHNPLLWKRECLYIVSKYTAIVRFFIWRAGGRMPPLSWYRGQRWKVPNAIVKIRWTSSSSFNYGSPP